MPPAKWDSPRVGRMPSGSTLAGCGSSWILIVAFTVADMPGRLQKKNRQERIGLLHKTGHDGYEQRTRRGLFSVIATTGEGSFRLLWRQDWHPLLTCLTPIYERYTRMYIVGRAMLGRRRTGSRMDAGNSVYMPCPEYQPEYKTEIRGLGMQDMVRGGGCRDNVLDAERDVLCCQWMITPLSQCFVPSGLPLLATRRLGRTSPCPRN